MALECEGDKYLLQGFGCVEARCEFLDGRLVDIHPVSQPLTVVKVHLGKGHQVDMDLTVSNRWYRIDGDSDDDDSAEFFNANLDEFEIEVRPSGNLLVVEATESRLGEVNCDSGVHFDWSDVTGLCGINDVEIVIDAVMHEVRDEEQSRAVDIRRFNDWITEELESYNGYDTEWHVDGEMLAPFVNT